MLKIEDAIEYVYMTPEIIGLFEMKMVSGCDVREHEGNALALWRRNHLLIALLLAVSDDYGVGDPRFK